MIKPNPRALYGGCPKCGDTNGYKNIHKAHWYFCNEHMTKWNPCWNVHCSWADETEEDWEANAVFLERYAEVEPTEPGWAYFPDIDQGSAPPLAPILHLRRQLPPEPF